MKLEGEIERASGRTSISLCYASNSKWIQNVTMGMKECDAVNRYNCIYFHDDNVNDDDDDDFEWLVASKHHSIFQSLYIKFIPGEFYDRTKRWMQRQ